MYNTITITVLLLYYCITINTPYKGLPLFIGAQGANKNNSYS